MKEIETYNQARALEPQLPNDASPDPASSTNPHQLQEK